MINFDSAKIIVMMKQAPTAFDGINDGIYWYENSYIGLGIGLQGVIHVIARYVERMREWEQQ